MAHGALRKQPCALSFFLPVSFSVTNKNQQFPHGVISWIPKVLSTVRECITTGGLPTTGGLLLAEAHALRLWAQR